MSKKSSELFSNFSGFLETFIWDHCQKVNWFENMYVVCTQLKKGSKIPPKMLANNFFLPNIKDLTNPIISPQTKQPLIEVEKSQNKVTFFYFLPNNKWKYFPVPNSSLEANIFVHYLEKIRTR